MHFAKEPWGHIESGGVSALHNGVAFSNDR